MLALYIGLYFLFKNDSNHPKESVQSKEHKTNLSSIDYSILRQWYPNDNPNGFGAEILLQQDLTKEDIISFLKQLSSNKEKGYIGIDIRDLPEVDIVADLEKGIPLPNESCSVIQADHFLEHHSDPVFILNEIWRVLKPGGEFIFESPSTEGQNAFLYFPEWHRSFWNELAFSILETSLAKEISLADKFKIKSLETVKKEYAIVAYVKGVLIKLGGKEGS
jgi:SAM-dependent methyltransferase